MKKLSELLASLDEKGVQIFLEQRAIEYEKVITYVFNKQTGVVAIVQLGDDISTRKQVTLNSGFRPERDMLGRLVVLGPFEQKRGKETIHYYRNLRGARVEFKDGLITRFVTSKGKVIDLGAGVKNFKGFSVAVNEQHAEMRLLRWAKITGWKIVGLAPTRGCCKHCHDKLVEVFKDKFESMVPKSRQTQDDYKAAGPEKKGRIRRKKTPKVKAAKGKLPKLPKGAGKALKGIAKTLKVLGPVMFALNAATTAAKAADELQHGRQKEATKTLAEFAGGIGGAWLFGAGLGLFLGPPGALIGAAIGASLGEQGARKVCDDIFRWVNSNVAFDHAKHGSAGRKPDSPRAKQPAHHPAPLTIRADLVEDMPRHYDDPAVAQLQAAMYENGYGHPQVNLVCKLLTDLNADGPSKATDPANLLVKLTSPQLDELMARAKLPAHYPMSDNTQSGYVSAWMEQKLLQGRVRPSHKGTTSQGARATAGALGDAPAGGAGHHGPQADPQLATNLAVGAVLATESRGQPATPDPAGLGSQGTGTAPPAPSDNGNAGQGDNAPAPPATAPAQGGPQTTTGTHATVSSSAPPAPSDNGNAGQGDNAPAPSATAPAQGGTQTTTGTHATVSSSTPPAPSDNGNAGQGDNAPAPPATAPAQSGTQTTTDTNPTVGSSAPPAPSDNGNAGQGDNAPAPSATAPAQGGTQTITDTHATVGSSAPPAPSDNGNAGQGDNAAAPPAAAPAQGGTQTITDTHATVGSSAPPAPSDNGNAGQGDNAAAPPAAAPAQGGTQTITDTNATVGSSAPPAPSDNGNAGQGDSAPAPAPAQGQAPAQDIPDTNVPANDASQSPSHADGNGGQSASPTAPSGPEQGNAPAPNGADPNAAAQPAVHANDPGAANDPGQAAASGAPQSAAGTGGDNAGPDAPAPTAAPAGQDGNAAQPATPAPSDATTGQGAGPGSGAAGTSTAGQTPTPMHVETSVSGVWLNAPHVTSIPELQAEMAPPLAGPFAGNNDPAGSQPSGTAQTPSHPDSDGQDEGPGQAFVPEVEAGQHAALDISIDQGHGFDASHSGGFDAHGHGGDSGGHGPDDGSGGGDGGDGAGHGDYGHAADQGGHSAPNAYGHHGYGGGHGAHGDHGSGGDHGDHGGGYGGGHGGAEGGGGDGGDA